MRFTITSILLLQLVPWMPLRASAQPAPVTLLQTLGMDGTADLQSVVPVRLRYRNSYSHPQLMHGGQVYSVALSGPVTATGMLPGHRLRIELASSNFPNYGRNLNSGGNNFDETTVKTARNRVVHGPHQASFIEFQVLPR
jgi:predicted acyl esterase